MASALVYITPSILCKPAPQVYIISLIGLPFSRLGRTCCWSLRLLCGFSAGAGSSGIVQRKPCPLGSCTRVRTHRSIRIERPGMGGTWPCPVDRPMIAQFYFAGRWNLRVRKETNVPPRIPSSGHLRPMPQSCNPRRRLRGRRRSNSRVCIPSAPHLRPIGQIDTTSGRKNTHRFLSGP